MKYIITNTKHKTNTIYLDADRFNMAVTFAIQSNVSKDQFNNILKDYSINYSKSMSQDAKEKVAQLRDRGEEFEIVDLAQYKGEEYKIYITELPNGSGEIRATTSPSNREGKFVVGMGFQYLPSLETNILQ